MSKRKLKQNDRLSKEHILSGKRDAVKQQSEVKSPERSKIRKGYFIRKLK